MNVPEATVQLSTPHRYWRPCRVALRSLCCCYLLQWTCCHHSAPTHTYKHWLSCRYESKTRSTYLLGDNRVDNHVRWHCIASWQLYTYTHAFTYTQSTVSDITTLDNTTVLLVQESRVEKGTSLHQSAAIHVVASAVTQPLLCFHSPATQHQSTHTTTHWTTQLLTLASANNNWQCSRNRANAGICGIKTNNMRACATSIYTHTYICF